MDSTVIALGATVSDKELVRLVRSGDAGAFQALAERYMQALKSRANRYSSVVGVDTDDFVQEGMLALFKAVKGFDEHAGIQFRTYAITCINNSMATAIKTHMKDLSQSAGVPIDAVSEDAIKSSSCKKHRLIEDIYIENEDSELLAWQIQSLLSNFERQVLKLYLRGHSYLQISELLSTSTKAVDNALQRVRRKLRPEL